MQLIACDPPWGVLPTDVDDDRVNPDVELTDDEITKFARMALQALTPSGTVVLLLDFRQYTRYFTAFEAAGFYMPASPFLLKRASGMGKTAASVRAHPKVRRAPPLPPGCRARHRPAHPHLG